MKLDLWFVAKTHTTIHHDRKIDTSFITYIILQSERKWLLSCFFISGDLEFCGEETYGASAHSDYGMVTLLATNGVPGLQACLMLTNQNPQL